MSNYKENIMERRVKRKGTTSRMFRLYNNNRAQEIVRELTENINDMEEINLIIAGDLNARIGEQESIIGRDADEGRKSKDKITNKEGTIIMVATLERGWIILNRNKEGDEEGEFTYIGPRGESVIDYAIVNTDVHEEVEKMIVDTRIESHHQPLTVYLKKMIGKERRKKEGVKNTIAIWTEDRIKEYTQKVKEIIINSSNTEDEMNELAEKSQEAIPTREIYINNNVNRGNKCWGEEYRI